MGSPRRRAAPTGGAAAARRSAADEAWAVLHELLASERRRFLSISAQLDLHPAQAGALLQMEADEPTPMHVLAKSLRCDNSNVTGIVDRLEARGIVARKSHPGDRRVRQVVLTERGVECQQFIRERMSAAPEAFRRLSAADQRLLRDVLRRALAAAEDDARTTDSGAAHATDRDRVGTAPASEIGPSASG